jgi:hypothetical protein
MLREVLTTRSRSHFIAPSPSLLLCHCATIRSGGKASGGSSNLIQRVLLETRPAIEPVAGDGVSERQVPLQAQMLLDQAIAGPNDTVKSVVDDQRRRMFGLRRMLDDKREVELTTI